MIMKMVTKFKVCTPKPDADLCMRVDLSGLGHRAAGPSWAVGRGPPGVRAAEPLGRRAHGPLGCRGSWAA